MVDGGSFSYSGSTNPFKDLGRHFMAPPKVLWRRWRLPLPLAVVPTALLTWLGLYAAPYLPPFNTGWRAFAVDGVLLAFLIITSYVVRPLRAVNSWAHGPFPPPAGAEKGWYLREPAWSRRIGLLLVAPPTALLQFWVQTAHDGGHTLDGSAALGAFFLWAGIIRGLITPDETAIAVTAAGLFNGGELYRWEEIGGLAMGDDDVIVATVNGRRRFLEVPSTDLKATDIFGLIKHYLVWPGDRAGIADAVWPSIVSYGPAMRP